jgi:hypothetical protein
VVSTVEHIRFNFTFDGNHYLQINGAAMGTKMALSYANIFMGDLEERLLLSSLKVFSGMVKFSIFFK